MKQETMRAGCTHGQYRLVIIGNFRHKLEPTVLVLVSIFRLVPVQNVANADQAETVILLVRLGGLDVSVGDYHRQGCIPYRKE